MLASFISQALNSWLEIVFGLLLGTILTLFFQKKIAPFFVSLKQMAKLIKKYWSFIFFFVFTSGIGYALIFYYAPSVNQSMVIGLYNHFVNLTFAIFVGYFAFLQVVENRLDKLREEADRYLIDKRYPRAIDLYEKCLAINSDEFDIWTNMLELYLIDGRYEKFDEKIGIAKKKKKYSENEIIYLYLLFAKNTLKEDIGGAKEIIRDILEYIKQQPNVLGQVRWGFEDMRGSDKFNSLGESTKKMYNNLADYLLRKMPPDKKMRFEQGEYELADTTS